MRNQSATLFLSGRVYDLSKAGLSTSEQGISFSLTARTGPSQELQAQMKSSSKCSGTREGRQERRRFWPPREPGWLTHPVTQVKDVEGLQECG